MAQRYKERLLAGNGVSSKSYESEVGLKLLQKMGWNKGNGLGKNQHGRTDCIQVQRREEGMGLGNKAEEVGPAAFKWNNNWWDHSYNNIASKINVNINNDHQNNIDSSDDSDNDSESEEPQPLNKKTIKKISKITQIAQRTRKLSQISCSSVGSVETEVLQNRLRKEAQLLSKISKGKKSNSSTIKMSKQKTHKE